MKERNYYGEVREQIDELRELSQEAELLVTLVQDDNAEILDCLHEFSSKLLKWMAALQLTMGDMSEEISGELDVYNIEENNSCSISLFSIEELEVVISNAENIDERGRRMIVLRDEEEIFDQFRTECPLYYASDIEVSEPICFRVGKSERLVRTSGVVKRIIRDEGAIHVVTTCDNVFKIQEGMIFASGEENNWYLDRTF
ncbi:hypothetical protein GF354_04695 [Candidatus Peregrinibacteria bacterium]|nr:hypothetical protein [Candidatus Peregrinibacteria bacterium]